MATEALFTDDTHPTTEELAALAEPGAPEWTCQRLVAHLARCRRCLAIHAEFVHMQARLLTDPAIANPPAQLLELGMAVATSNHPAARWRAHSHGVRPRRILRPAMALVAVVGCAAVLSIWPRAQRHAPLPTALLQDITEQAQRDAQGGLLYSERMLPRARATRGADAPLNLDLLVDRFGDGSQSADADYWLITGLLSSNQKDTAEPYLEESLAHFPDDARLQNLAAVLAYKRNDPVAAQERLRRILASPLGRPPAALVNLAILRRQQGDEAEAQDLLREVQARFPGAPIATLAGSLATDR